MSPHSKKILHSNPAQGLSVYSFSLCLGGFSQVLWFLPTDMHSVGLTGGNVSL